MNRPDDRWSDPLLDRELSRLLEDAVTDVEPTDRLDEIRARTADTSRRPWLLATGGAVLAAAAVVTAVALVSGDALTTEDPSPAGTPTSNVPTTGDPTTDGAPGTTSTVGVYYLGDSPAGVRLYREVREGDGEPLAAALALLTSSPGDPDYRTGWTDGQLLGATLDGEGRDAEIAVEIDPGVRERPPGLTDDEARSAVQQVVYTTQGVVQDRAPVRFYADGEPVDQVLGVPTPGPVTAGAPLETLSHVNLTTPEEGATVAGHELAVEGVANSYEANVLWRLEADGEAVAESFITAEGWMGEELFPFSGSVDVSSLSPGTYTLIVETDDPTGGQEGPGAYSDTRTVVIE